MAEYLMSELQVPGVGDPVMIIKDKEARDDLSTALATVTGNPLNFSTRSAQKANKTVISLEPIQDLHGYDHPWPEGGGKNQLPMTVDGIKELNPTTTTRVWDGNVCKIGANQEMIVTILTDSDNNVIGIKFNGIYTSNVIFKLANFTFLANTSYSMNGCPSGGGNRYLIGTNTTPYQSEGPFMDAGSGVTFSYSQDSQLTPNITVYANNQVNNLVFYPMIRLATETDPTFVPYSNYCPIDGRTETSLVGCGKNLISAIEAYAYNSDGTTYFADRRCRTPIFFVKSGIYTLQTNTTATGKTVQTMYETWKNDSYTNNEMLSESQYASGNQTITIESDTYISMIYKYSDNSIISYTELKSQLELGSTATDYEPYVESNNLTIQFGEKVYGATLTMETGELVVTWGYIAEYNGETLPGEWISDRDVYAPGTTPTTGAEVCYELATPRTIQLTPNEISLLSGVNVISSNADGISLTYRDGKVATLGDLDSLNVTISNALEGKVDEVPGKELSTNDYTDEEKAKVAEVDDKANDDGSYGDMAVGSLLMSNKVKSTDTNPFLFRAIPPLSTPYIREKLVGASMVWNQLVANGNFADTSNWSATRGTISASGNVLTYTVSEVVDNSVGNRIDQSISLVNGHKYLFRASVNPSKNTNFRFVFQTSDVAFTKQLSSSSGTWNSFSSVISVENANVSSCSARIAFNSSADGYSVGDTIQIKSIYIVDLTLAFYPAIADRIYSMEQAQAGSGISWIKSYGFLTDDYYATDAGSIQSVCADRKEIVGFNQWDEETAYGYWNIADGNWVAGQQSGAWKGSKNYIQCLPNTAYYHKIDGSLASSTGAILFYDGNKNYIGSIDGSSNIKNKVFTTPSDTYYMTFYHNKAYFEQPICINISDTAKNGTYEPYHKTTISLGHDELRGVMQLDADNNLVYYGDEKTNDGVIDRKFTIVDLGTLGWNSGYNGWYSYDISIKQPSTRDEIANIVCTKYTPVAINNRTASTNNISVITGASTAVHNGGVIVIDSTTYADAAAFTAAVTGTYLVCELVTPTTEQSTPFESPQYLFDGGTEEFVDYGVEQETRDVAVPVGHVTEYMGASDGTEIKDKFYLPTLPSYDGEYIPHMRIQGGMITGFWFEPVVEDGD